MNKTIFLDRDGTLIHDTGYLSDPAGVRFLDDVAPSLRRLSQAGYNLVVVSNQSGIGRGWITEDQYRAVDSAVLSGLAAQGVAVSGSYFCPHEPQAGCDCRKPKPGMLTRASRDFSINLGESVMIGDKFSDVQAGLAAGCTTVLVNRKPAEEDHRLSLTVRPHFECQNWSAVCSALLAQP